MARAVEDVEFEPEAPVAVVERMARIAAEGDGWVNLLPGVPDDEVVEQPRSVLFALFGKAQPPVSMCTWVPASRGGRREQTVGLMHAKGRHAVAQLTAAGVELPAGWRVGQDNARRGLIVHPPRTASFATVLNWSLRATAALSLVPLTGRWTARAYLPKGR